MILHPTAQFGIISNQEGYLSVANGVSSHDVTAAFERLEDLRQQLLHHIFSVILLALLAAAVVRLLWLGTWITRLSALMPAVMPAVMAISRGADLILRWHFCWSATQVDVDSTRILLGRVLEAKFLAELLDTRLQFLNMVGGVISLADDAVPRV